VHGALYADRLDPFSAFKPDDLELISAVAAQTAIAVENVRAHERLAREEVARANYGRFLPEYVVKQMLEILSLSNWAACSKQLPYFCRHPRFHSHLRTRAAGKDRATA